MPAANLHLTLAFIGEIPGDTAHRIAEQLRGLQAEAGSWKLDRVGAFRRARVLWAGGAPPPALASLAADVRAMLDRLGVTYDRKPFVPHVTLLRDVALRQTVDAPIEPAVAWTVNAAVLLQSTPAGGSVRYEAVA